MIYLETPHIVHDTDGVHNLNTQFTCCKKKAFYGYKGHTAQKFFSVLLFFLHGSRNFGGFNLEKTDWIGLILFLRFGGGRGTIFFFLLRGIALMDRIIPWRGGLLYVGSGVNLV